MTGGEVGAPPAGRSGRRLRLGSRLAVVLLVLAGAGLVLASAGRSWVGAAVTGVPGLPTVSASGQDAAPGLSAAALVAAAGAAALAVAGRVVRMVVATLLVLAGAALLALVWSVVADPAAALAPTLVAATGQTGAAPGSAARLTGWFWPAAAGGVLVAGGGIIGVLRGRSWALGGRRYQAGAGAAAPAGGAAPPGGGSGAPAGGGGAAARDSALDAWDALSRGDDPTG